MADVLMSRPYRFGALREQFIASESVLATLPSDWNVDTLGKWHLYRHPSTKMIPIEVGGHSVGWLVGEAWEGDRLVRDSLGVSSESELLNRIDGLAGALAAIVPGRFVRQDSMGQQSVVYSPTAGAVATNPLLIRAACGGDLDRELVDLMDIPKEDRWYPFGLTPVVGVSRLLPNHRLDLQTWDALRYWPTPEDVQARPATAEEAIEIVRRCVRDSVDALATGHSLQLGLTAGYDSRIILACARKHAPTLVCSTNIMHPSTEKVDHPVARRVARIAGVPHETRDQKTSTAEERADFVDQTGLSAAGARYRHIALMNAFGEERVLLYGHGSEVLRGLYHRRLLARKQPFDSFKNAEVAFSLLKLPFTPRLLKAHDQWVASLPLCSGAAGLSLLYHEQRKGCWAATLRLSGKSRPVWAFAQRDLLRLMLRLPIEAQLSQDILRGVIAAEWPDLLRVPFNDMMGLARVLRDVGRLPGIMRFRLGAIRQRLFPR